MIAKTAALALMMLAALQPATARTMTADRGPLENTRIESAAMLERLRGNSGITLQWISWDYRGHVRVTDSGGLVHLSGEQDERGGPGQLTLDGDVMAIDADSFTFRGHISIIGAPDEGRVCERDGTFEFLITQNRRYWRPQHMEACDGLTDYVDIYF
jgi:hypothetical protein